MAGGVWVLGILMGLAGCRFHYDPIAADDGGARRDAAPDGERGDASKDDALDASAFDADPAAPDAAQGVVPEGARDCSVTVTDAVARYDFETTAGDMVIDAIGGNHGALRGTEWSLVPGPPGCGNALYFGPGNNGSGGDVGDGDASESAAVIPDDGAWELPTGSLDFWVRLDSCAFSTEGGIVSRGASGMHHGDLDLRANGCQLTVGMEGDTASGSLGRSYFFDTAWHHIGINFAPDGHEIWVDGQLRDEPGWFAIGGIDGNDNPWIFGASARASADASADPLSDFARGIAIDRVRISSRWRNFE